MTRPPLRDLGPPAATLKEPNRPPAGRMPGKAAASEAGAGNGAAVVEARRARKPCRRGRTWTSAAADPDLLPGDAAPPHYLGLTVTRGPNQRRRSRHLSPQVLGRNRVISSGSLSAAVRSTTAITAWRSTARSVSGGGGRWGADPATMLGAVTPVPRHAPISIRCRAAARSKTEVGQVSRP